MEEEQIVPDPEITPYSDDDLSHLSITKLKKMLSSAVNDEDYILAAKIRDAIKRIEEQK